VAGLIDAAYAAAAAGSDAGDAPGAAPTTPAPRRRWFRPGRGWLSGGLLAVARRTGHTVVLGTVWPWDTVSRCAYLNALYVWLKAYTGAVIVLHDKWVASGALGRGRGALNGGGSALPQG
jgi:peptidoglycan/xylan/chitin deacetylase (PgdA/CDA1 family)